MWACEEIGVSRAFPLKELSKEKSSRVELHYTVPVTEMLEKDEERIRKRFFNTVFLF